MSTRSRLPDRRGSQTFPVVCEGQVYRATVSLYDDGRFAEVFLSASKANSGLDTIARDAAILASLAAQYHCPIDVMLRALTRNSDGSPASPIGVALAMVDQ